MVGPVHHTLVVLGVPCARSVYHLICLFPCGFDHITVVLGVHCAGSVLLAVYQRCIYSGVGLGTNVSSGG